MKIQTLKRLIMLSVLVVLATVSVHAQEGRQFTVTIPFDFSVAGKAMTAGQYLVGRAAQTSSESLVIRRIDGSGNRCSPSSYAAAIRDFVGRGAPGPCSLHG